MRILTIIALSFCSAAYAGQSLTIGTDTVSNSSVAAQPQNGACRLETFQHDGDADPTGNYHSLSPTACGINWRWIPVSPTDIRIEIYGDFLTGTTGICQIMGLADHLTTGFYTRFQIVPSGAGGTTRCQAWDAAGNRIWSTTQTYTGTTAGNTNGMTVTGAGTAKNINWGFVKLYTTTVALEARMPVHGEDGDLLSWRFDGNLNDASTGPGTYNGTHSGTPGYDTTTPGQDLIKAVVKTTPAPTWGDRRTLRVGVPNALDASDSFSQADASPSVTADWSVISTVPTPGLTLTFDDATNNLTPTANPNAFGDYLVQVALTDATPTTYNAQVHIGAVEMDANGVVQPSDPNVTKIFGPMIALGWNPWGWMDERWTYAHTARRAVYQTAPSYLPSYTRVSNPVWNTALAGTVDYTWNGTGIAAGAPGTTLNGAITSSTDTIVLNSTTGLDLSSLPTKIVIISGSTSEEIDICSVATLTLTVCYDGRGKVGPGGTESGSKALTVLGPTPWSDGATVGQRLIKGTGTNFIASEGICEAGAGPVGPTTYSDGTVSVTAGSASVTGSGTSWLTNASVLSTGSAAGIYSAAVSGASWTGGTATVTVATALWSVGMRISVQGVSPAGYNVTNAAVTAVSGTSVSYAVVGDPGAFSSAGTAYTSNGYAIRIEGTHNAGTPFTFYAYIATAESNTALTMNRVFPADADTDAGLTYQIVRPFYRYPVTGFTVEQGAEDNNEATIGWAGTTCASDTQAFFNPDIGGTNAPGYDGTSLTGRTITFYDVDSLTINQGGGVNFYGEELAWYAGHFRSGLYEPLETARMMANNYVKFPGLRGGYGNFNPYSPLLVGGGIIGAIACLVVDSGCGLEWKNVRGFVNQGNYWATNAGMNITCNTQDSRDGGYYGNWFALGALYDPMEATYGWRAGLPTWEAFEDGCKQSDNSWANNYLINLTAYPAVTFTSTPSPSTAGTGTDFVSGMCFGRASGNFSIDAGTGVVTATSSAFNSASDQRTLVLNVSGHRLVVQVGYTDSTHMTIRATWPAGWATTGTWMQLVGETGDLIGMTAWGQNTASTSYQKNYECIYNSSTSITLERPWEEANGAYIPTVSTRLGTGIAGYGQQPYMAAIKTYGFQIASYMDADAGTDFANLRNLIATWTANTGYDTAVKGMRYGAVYQSCEPVVTPVGSGGTSFTQPGCSYSLDATAQIASRALNGEAARAFVYNTTDNITRGDDQYEALWCSTLYNDSALYPAIPACDSVTPGDNIGLSIMGDAYFAGDKWSGFFFGMGMGHQWPAARLGTSAAFGRLSGKVSTSGNVVFR